MFANRIIKRFDHKVYLASPTKHEEMMTYARKAFDDNWMSTIGENINELEKIAAEKSGVKHAVALCNCTSALHLCVKLAGEKLYGKPPISYRALEGKRVFCSDLTFSATINPVVYEGGVPVFIDTDENSWNMDPIALEKAFELYPDVKLVICAELYGFPGRMDQIREICNQNNAILIEDAAEALGATIDGRQCGSFGDYSAISFNGNKIITGSSGGCLLTNNIDDANQARKWSTQSRENAPWYQHEQIGYNYRMSNFIAGAVRGQYPYLESHIAQKKEIYERYREGLAGLPIHMNPITVETKPNFWLSSLIIDSDAMCMQVRNDNRVLYCSEHGKSCPTEILEALSAINAEGRPIWKPMHMQPLYRMHNYVTREGNARAKTNAYINSDASNSDVGADIFNRGLCLPSDNKMTENEQCVIIQTIIDCFG